MNRTFDIVIPTYNRRDMLLQAVASAMAQTVPVRVAVVDNASEDGSAAAVRDRWGDRVEVHRFEQHVPYQANLNRCVSFLAAAAGLILHDDDLVDPDYASFALECFARVPAAGLVVVAARPIQSRGSAFRRARMRPPYLWFAREGRRGEPGVLVLPPGELAEALVRNTRMCPYWPTVSYRRTVLGSDPFPADLRTLLDYEAWIRIAARHPVVLSDRVLCSYRFHGSMMTSRLIWPRTRAFEDDILVMRRRLAATLGREPGEALEVALLSKALYPVMLLGASARRAQYERYLADSGYPLPRLVAAQQAEFDAFWRVKGWGPLARWGWRAHRVLETTRHWRDSRKE